jgi:hypothetical protein
MVMMQAERQPDTESSKDVLRGQLRWRLAPGSVVSAGPMFERAMNSWQYVATVATAGEPRYIVGEIHQTTVGAQVRADHTFTPELSFQLYAQPFVSAGAYRLFRVLGDPQAKRFAERFVAIPAERLEKHEGRYEADLNADGVPDARFADPSYSTRQLNVNAVLRWEYRPGSAILLAWSHDRDAFGGDGRFRFADDVRRLMRASADDVVMLKASLWLSL